MGDPGTGLCRAGFSAAGCCRPALLVALLALLLVSAPGASGQADRTPDDLLPLPRKQQRADDGLGTAKDGIKQDKGPDILPVSFADYIEPALPVKLLDVLRLGVLANLDIVQAQLAVERAQARLLRVQSSFLPNLSLGATYTAHDGKIQRTEGNVIEANRDSLFTGLTSAWSVSLSDAIFGPDEYRALIAAAQAGQVAVTNDVLLRVADAYFNVLRARRRLARLDEVLDMLTSEEKGELRGNVIGLLPMIRAFVVSGNAVPSDQARVEADVVRRHEERVRALQELRTASAELARLLHLPCVFFLPAEDYRWPLPVPGEPWFCQPCEELVAQGLRSRPELAENQALLEAALTRYRNAYWRPLLPNVVVNYSYGGFGGGPQVVRRTSTGGIVLGDSRTIADFGTRSDIDISLVWRLQGLGLGNRAQQWLAHVQVEQTQVRQMQLYDLIISQVIRAIETVRRGYERVAVTGAGLFDEQGRPEGAVYRSIRLNFVRIYGGQGSPLEVLDSIRRLSDVLDQYANALTDFDEARFRLLVALGMPPATLVNPELLPLPPHPCPPRPLLPWAPAEKKDNRSDKAEDEKDRGGKDAERLPLPNRLPPPPDRGPAQPGAAPVLIPQAPPVRTIQVSTAPLPTGGPSSAEGAKVRGPGGSPTAPKVNAPDDGLAAPLFPPPRQQR